MDLGLEDRRSLRGVGARAEQQRPGDLVPQHVLAGPGALRSCPRYSTSWSTVRGPAQVGAQRFQHGAGLRVAEHGPQWWIWRTSRRPGTSKLMFSVEA